MNYKNGQKINMDNGGLVYNAQGEELSFIPEAILKVEDLNKKLLDMIISNYLEINIIEV